IIERDQGALPNASRSPSVGVVPSVDLARRIFRSLGYATWLTVSNVVALLTGLGLLGACINSTYSEENRAPAGRIVVAAITFAVGPLNSGGAGSRPRGTPR